MSNKIKDFALLGYLKFLGGFLTSLLGEAQPGPFEAAVPDRFDRRDGTDVSRSQIVHLVNHDFLMGS